MVDKDIRQCDEMKKCKNAGLKAYFLSLIHILFREEEFEGFDGAVHTSTKPFYAVSIDKVEEAKIPNPKKLAQKGEDVYKRQP